MTHALTVGDRYRNAMTGRLWIVVDIIGGRPLIAMESDREQTWRADWPTFLTFFVREPTP
jgi:hypothetical protein